MLISLKCNSKFFTTSLLLWVWAMWKETSLSALFTEWLWCRLTYSCSHCHLVRPHYTAQHSVSRSPDTCSTCVGGQDCTLFVCNYDFAAYTHNRQLSEHFVMWGNIKEVTTERNRKRFWGELLSVDSHWMAATNEWECDHITRRSVHYM